MRQADKFWQTTLIMEPVAQHNLVLVDKNLPFVVSALHIPRKSANSADQAFTRVFAESRRALEESRSRMHRRHEPD